MIVTYSNPSTTSLNQLLLEGCRQLIFWPIWPQDSRMFGWLPSHRLEAPPFDLVSQKSGFEDLFGWWGLNLWLSKIIITIYDIRWLYDSLRRCSWNFFNSSVFLGISRLWLWLWCGLFGAALGCQPDPILGNIRWSTRKISTGDKVW